MQKTLKKYFPIFLFPTVIAFCIAFVIPFITGLYLSFCNFTTVSNAKFVGLENYIKAFSASQRFGQAFGFTTILSGFYIGKTNIEYYTKSKYILNIFKLTFITITLSGIIVNNFFIWNYLDTLIFIMIIINSYSIIKSLGSE